MSAGWPGPYIEESETTTQSHASLLAVVGLDVVVDRVAARLLLALDQELDVDRQRAALGEHGRDRLQVGVGLALVVGGAAATSRSPSSVGSNGGCRHSSIGSAGCTS